MTLTLDTVSTLSQEEITKTKSKLIDLLDKIEQHLNEDNTVDLISEMHIDESYDHLDLLSSQKADETWIQKAKESIAVLQVIQNDLVNKSMRLEEIEMI